MARTPRKYSEQQQRQVWDRWHAGLSVAQIARELGKKPAGIRSMLLSNGGIVPPVRKRRATALSLCEREEISRAIAAGHSMRQIARDINRAPSTISREIARNGGMYSYRAIEADQQACKSALRPQQCLLAKRADLRQIVATGLAWNWSPEQISGWLKTLFPNDQTMWVSHETIYQSLFIQARGVLKKELTNHLRRKRKMRRSKNASTANQKRGQIVDAISISQRPPAVEDRAIPGHWEGDLIAGSKNTHIATLVERSSRFCVLVKVSGKDTETVVDALTAKVHELPDGLFESLTWDRGKELARHKDFTVATDVKVYFCDPQSPWQRGSNENTNGLLRQYFPKKTDLSQYSQQELDVVAMSLNTRPRKTLGFQTPAAKLDQVLH